MYGCIAVLLSAVTGVSAQITSQILTTPPLFVVVGDNVACEVVNVAGSGVWVTTSVVNSAGQTTLSTTLFMAAGTSTQTDFLVPDGGNDRYYCRFECSGAACDLRAAIAHFTAGTDVSGYPAQSSSQ